MVEFLLRGGAFFPFFRQAANPFDNLRVKHRGQLPHRRASRSFADDSLQQCHRPDIVRRPCPGQREQDGKTNSVDVGAGAVDCLSGSGEISTKLVGRFAGVTLQVRDERKHLLFFFVDRRSHRRRRRRRGLLDDHHRGDRHRRDLDGLAFRLRRRFNDRCEFRLRLNAHRRSRRTRRKHSDDSHRGAGPRLWRHSYASLSRLTGAALRAGA